jgi:hypothetical protein
MDPSHHHLLFIEEIWCSPAANLVVAVIANLPCPSREGDGSVW